MARRGRGARGVPHEPRPVAPLGRGVPVVPPPPQPNVAPEDDLRQMFQSMRQLLEQNAAFQQALIQQIPRAPVAPHANPNADYWVLQDRFKKEVGLQKFEGSSDPMEAEKWLDLVKDAFDYLGVPETSKLQMVTHQLAGEAQHWWRSIVTSRQGIELTWDDFQRAFMDLYFPESVRSELRMRFERLKQKEDMSVREYQAEFDRLSRYGTHIVPDDRSRARRFEHGLRDSIRVMVEPQILPTFAGVVECALIVERNEKNAQLYVRKGTTGDINRVDKPKRSEVRVTPYERSTTQPMMGQGINRGCIHCGRINHTSDKCQVARMECFRCGKHGHFVKDCPSNVVSKPASISRAPLHDIRPQTQGPHPIVAPPRRQADASQFYALGGQGEMEEACAIEGDVQERQ